MKQKVHYFIENFAKPGFPPAIKLNKVGMRLFKFVKCPIHRPNNNFSRTSSHLRVLQPVFN